MKRKITMKQKVLDQAAMEPLLDSVAVLRGKRSGHALSDGEEALRHYSIVAAMLDPKGPHGLGNEPLNAFFDTVSPGAREYILQENDCIVENEYSIRDRQMTVVIRNRIFCVAVEINLTPGESARLKATEEWLIRRPDAHKILFYLTWPGNFSNDPTLLRDGYFAISFRRDIRDCIMKCSLAAWEKNYSSVHEFCHRYCSCLQETMHYPY